MSHYKQTDTPRFIGITSALILLLSSFQRQAFVKIVQAQRFPSLRMARYIPPHIRSKEGPSSNADSAGGTPEAPPVETARRTLSELEVTTPEHKGNNKGEQFAVDQSNGSPEPKQLPPSRPLYTLREIHAHYKNQTGVHSTLNQNPEDPGRLGYIILFRNANPKWHTQRTIFAKTNIDLLPGYAAFKAKSMLPESSNDAGEQTDSLDEHETSTSPDGSKENGDAAVENTNSSPSASTAVDTFPSTDPVPIFLEVAKKKGVQRKFLFYGYYSAFRIDFVRSRSSRLVTMLKQKWEIPNAPQKGYDFGKSGGRGWSAPRSNDLAADATASTPGFRTGRERDSDAWQRSLNQEWAVLKLKKVVEEALGGLQDPEIEGIKDDYIDSKGRGGSEELDNTAGVCPESRETSSTVESKDEEDSPNTKQIIEPKEVEDHNYSEESRNGVQPD